MRILSISWCVKCRIFYTRTIGIFWVRGHIQYIISQVCFLSNGSQLSRDRRFPIYICISHKTCSCQGRHHLIDSFLQTIALVSISLRTGIGVDQVIACSHFGLHFVNDSFDHCSAISVRHFRCVIPCNFLKQFRFRGILFQNNGFF